MEFSPALLCLLCIISLVYLWIFVLYKQLVWIWWTTSCFQYSTIVYIYAFNNSFIYAATTMTHGLYAGPEISYKLCNNHQPKSKGTRKGSHKAKQGHSLGVDFSMGYWTEIENTSVIELRFCFAFNLWQQLYYLDQLWVFPGVVSLVCIAL